MSYLEILQLGDSSIRMAVPLLLACLAGLYSERSGIIDIGLEGKMLGAAFAAAATAAVTGSPWLGLLAAMLVSTGMSMIHALASINMRGNQVISGVALNFLALGVTIVLGDAWFRRGGNTPNLSSDQRFSPIDLPFATQLQDVPVIGPLYAQLISGHNLLVYLAFLAVPVTAFVLFRTRFGLRLRAVGENPTALDTAGMSVSFLRYQALIITGLLCGVAGAYLSTAQGASFTDNMTAGRGFIALAALIFAKWKPVPALFTCLLFGFLSALQIRLQGMELPLIGEVPVQAVQALPYILTVVLLAGFIGRAVAPKASGQPYVKER
ncbi:ABC transporter permease [Mariluticola halotolerans]|uniref:ABC transporter permease n=1 Tax=Mariluticola halotolerans TaxID=2909283 RepID=UPI0026E3948F|nr:ABC transporter permease [Mariluticola halotolerans]UJQ93177.1 ABC transporter permease [Mariluticola halotolerans]